jgi:hypothetical protein
MNFFLASWLYSDWLWLQGKAHFRGMLLMAWFTRRWYDILKLQEAALLSVNHIALHGRLY